MWKNYPFPVIDFLLPLFNLYTLDMPAGREGEQLFYLHCKMYLAL